MNTRGIASHTLWAVLAMEAGLALPLISLPAQGDRQPGLPGPVLLIILLPLGLFSVRRLPALRDPSWRLLLGIGAALLARLIVSSVPQPGAAGLALWLTRNLVPAAIGVGLWWRGGALSVAELTPSEVRAEFSVLALCTLAMLVLIRPFVLADQALLGAAVGLFAVGGLSATAFSRQDAADVPSGGSGQGLGSATALLPVGAAVVAVSILQPALLGAMWLTLARLIELALMPLGWFFAWLASFLPRGQPIQGLPPAAPPPLDFRPDPAALAEMQDRLSWLGPLVLMLLVLLVSLTLLLVVRVMLANWIGAPGATVAERGPAVTVEASGAPRADALAFLGWLRRWLRTRLGGTGRPGLGGLGRAGGTYGLGAAEPAAVDAWAAYQRLLAWAQAQGLGRRPSETTGQLQRRLMRQVPGNADALELVTSTFEQERYGDKRTPNDRLQRLRAALASITAPRQA